MKLSIYTGIKVEFIMRKEFVERYLRRRVISEKEMGMLLFKRDGTDIKKKNEELLCYSIHQLERFCNNDDVSFDDMYNKVDENELIELPNQCTNISSLRVLLILYFRSLKNNILSEQGKKVVKISVYEYDKVLRCYRENNLSPNNADIIISERLNIPIEKVRFVLEEKGIF